MITGRPEGDKHTADGSADKGRQLTLMNARAISAITESEERWPEAGDQFFVDFDLESGKSCLMALS